MLDAVGGSTAGNMTVHSFFRMNEVTNWAHTNFVCELSTEVENGSDGPHRYAAFLDGCNWHGGRSYDVGAACEGAEEESTSDTRGAGGTTAEEVAMSDE